MEKPLANQTLAVTSVDDAAFKKVSFVGLGVPSPSSKPGFAASREWRLEQRTLPVQNTPNPPPVQAAKRVSGQRTIATLNSLL